MYNRVRRKMHRQYLICLVLMLQYISAVSSISVPAANGNLYKTHNEEYEDNNIIDFESDYDKKFVKKYENWRIQSNFDKDRNKYVLVNEDNAKVDLSASTTSEMPVPMEITTETKKQNKDPVVQNVTIEFSTNNPLQMIKTTETDVSVIPLELLSTVDPSNIIDSTTERDLTVIPLSTTNKNLPNVQVDETAILPTSTESIDETTTELLLDDFIEGEKLFALDKNVLEKNNSSNAEKVNTSNNENFGKENNEKFNSSNKENINKSNNSEEVTRNQTTITKNEHRTENLNETIYEPNDKTLHDIQANATEIKITVDRDDRTILEEQLEPHSEESEVPVFTALDIDGADDEVPEDYYDSKDLIPTKAPSTDALSVLFGFAGSVVESMVESVAERVVPKGIYDLFKRMQKQSEALEAEKLRSREENGGLGSFGRGILKTISSGLSKPLSQLMGAKDNGSLDSDRSFVSSLASGVSSVATSLVDTFKDRVQAIYPGTVWCGDGRSAAARSSELGLFFFTDTCCRQHDACKMYIRAGETKHGLTNTGLFTRSHCSCDSRFRECLRRTNSLISAQIGLTYFNVLGPQCFRRTHPIIRCLRRTRITGQKCEEYELDYTKPKMWQWFDNETF